MDFTFKDDKKPESVWDKIVPIVKNGSSISIYITSELEMPNEYNEAHYVLMTAEEYETVDIYINCPGGVVDTAFYLHDSITNCKARTTAILSGTVASGGTIITMACDAIKIAPFTQFMIHNYSAHGISGKGHEIKDYVKFNDAELNKAFKEIYGTFLTGKEIQEIIDGKDYWLNRQDVYDRWETYKSNIETIAE